MVDDADWTIVSDIAWSLSTKGYVIAKVDGKAVKMHQLIAGHGVDHISRDPLDNRRSNLRPATAAQNSSNRRRRVDNTSGYVGVYRRRRGGARPWTATVTANGREYFVGAFATRDEAAKARDAAAAQLHGEFVRLTYPNDG